MVDNSLDAYPGQVLELKPPVIKEASTLSQNSALYFSHVSTVGIGEKPFHVSGKDGEMNHF